MPVPSPQHNNSSKSGAVTLLSESDLRWLPEKCDALVSSKAGTRNLLDHEWVRSLSKKVVVSPGVESLLPNSPVAAQCTYFSKNRSTNWLVLTHQDRSIPARRPFSSPGCLRSTTWWSPGYETPSPPFIVKAAIWRSQSATLPLWSWRAATPR
jgi:hypothetical protein